MSAFNPYPHQKAGIDWIVQHKACALLWGMGTGRQDGDDTDRRRSAAV